MKQLAVFFNRNFYHCCLFFAYSLIITSLQAQQFKGAVSNDFGSQKSTVESRIKTLKSDYKKALEKKDTIQIIKNLIALSEADRLALNYSEAFVNSGEALFIAKEFNNKKWVAKAHQEFGILNYLFKQDEEAGEHFKASHSYFSKIKTINNQAILDKLQSHYNLVLYYQRVKNSKALKIQIDSCNLFSYKINDGLVYRLFLNEKKASIFELEKKEDKALQLLLETNKKLDSLLEIHQLNAVAASFRIILYSRIATVYAKKKEWELAKPYFEKSIGLKDLTGENTFYRAFVYSKYAQLLFELQDYKNAYLNLAFSKAINDTYLNPRNEDTQGFLTIKNRYSDQLRKKNELLYTQNLELEKQTQALFRFRIFFFVIVLLSIIVALVVRSKIRAIKHQKEEVITKEQIESKNKELTANMLHLIEKEVIINTLRDHLEDTRTDHSTKKILSQIEKNSVSLWDSFNNRFMALNENFYERLQEKAPDLSSADLKICALIKLNFSGKEMAHLLGISLGSVHVARHRLRKKMNLERDINLTNFISSI